MSAAVRIRHFTDPGCPWAFSAEPRRLRLEWLFGEQLEWQLRMVVLAQTPEEYEEKGFTPAKQSGAYKTLQDSFGMPIDWTERPRMAGTMDACRAIVAARLNAPGSEAALLRRLRVLGMGGGLLDDPTLLTRAATEAGLDPAHLDSWARAPEVEAALQADRTAARTPSPAARALDHKLAGSAEERRYTCPSLELEATNGGTRIDLPGFQPLEATEAALANLAPELERRPAPESVAEVLAWARMPLATVEVATVMGADITDVRAQLARSGAAFEPVGGDGYWSEAA